MHDIHIRRARREELDTLLDIWQRAVERTHDFLTPADVAFYRPLVQSRYLPYAELWVAAEPWMPLGFMGLAGRKVESLFVDPDHLRRGVGRALLAHAFRLRGPLLIDVNEQNHAARAFYARMGFDEVGRSERDDLGKPFPLIHLAASGMAEV
ncbi:acetyltransferase [Terrihabitans rhizophilus]|uniref:Acetyltransferase n=1 Tax=Terrihabitans rhizophilus TaxID=3092662 RepID=A0ABU4RLJ4_9HYPH|nr:acetyltransferase [Terrihabitans sp. PJ23]MDX6805694.1 acetyltransferase [Terrihabitans sp. PJ23]